MPRPTPFDLVFPQLAETVFPADSVPRWSAAATTPPTAMRSSWCRRSSRCCTICGRRKGSAKGWTSWWRWRTTPTSLWDAGRAHASARRPTASTALLGAARSRVARPRRAAAGLLRPVARPAGVGARHRRRGGRADGRLLRPHRRAASSACSASSASGPTGTGFSAVEAVGPAAPRAGARPTARRSSRPCSRAGRPRGSYLARRRRGAARARLAHAGPRQRALGRGRDDGRRPQLHGQEGRRPGAGADRRVPRAQGRESVPHPRLPHGGPRRRRLPGRPARGARDGSLASTKGVGPATLQIVAEIVTTGRASMLEELREQIPPGLVEMLAISGLGVAKIRQIHEVLDIDSLPELEAAALDGRLARLPRFGPKTSENILKGIAFLRQASALPAARITRPTRRKGCAPRSSGCRACSRRSSPATCGGASEVVRDLVLVIVADVAPGRAVQAAEPAAGRARVRRPGRPPADAPLRRRRERADRGDDAGEHRRRAGAGHRQRGPPAPARRPRRDARPRAHRRGALARQRVRADAGRGHVLPARSGSTPSRPSCARAQGEIDAAAAHTPAAAARARPTCGAFCTATPATPTGRIRSRSWRWPAVTAGYAYVGITDHSQAAAYAGGLRPDDLARQADEIDEVNAPARGHPGAQGRRGGHPAGRPDRLRRGACWPGSIS